jgi:TM2 domain-containing membrane protein YozV
MAVFCTKCGAQNEDYAQVCAQCQAALPQIGGYQPIQPPSPMYASGGDMQDWKRAGADKKIVAGLLGVLAGGFGIHKFILGYTTEGIIQIVITFVTCGMGSIVGLIEGIIYLTKSDEDFVRTYIQNKRGWF